MEYSPCQVGAGSDCQVMGFSLAFGFFVAVAEVFDAVFEAVFLASKQNALCDAANTKDIVSTKIFALVFIVRQP